MGKIPLFKEKMTKEGIFLVPNPHIDFLNGSMKKYMNGEKKK